MYYYFAESMLMFAMAQGHRNIYRILMKLLRCYRNPRSVINLKVFNIIQRVTLVTQHITVMLVMLIIKLYF